MLFINNTEWQYANSYDLWSPVDTAISNMTSLTSTTIINYDKKMRTTPSLSTAPVFNEKIQLSTDLARTKSTEASFKCNRIALTSYDRRRYFRHSSQLIMIMQAWSWIFVVWTTVFDSNDDDVIMSPLFLTKNSIRAFSASNLATRITSNA